MSPSLLGRFGFPGLIDELPEGASEQWTTWLSGRMTDGRRGNPEEFDFDSPRSQFFDPTKTEIDDDARQRDISWFAFPKRLVAEGLADRDRWSQSDGDRDKQDEYCEWAVQRNASGKLTRVTFTTETPEYWDLLAKSDPDLLLSKYREMVGPEVQPGDLLNADGTYNRRNEWNMSTERGPVHLAQVNNTLAAAVELAAAATIVRKIDGALLTSEAAIIECSGNGEPRRNSDPHIGAQVNELARMDADVALADPPGLYITTLSVGGWKTPDGTDPKAFWRHTRGEKGLRVRSVYEVTPEASKDYVVGDITINGRPIEFGAQIADFVSVRLTGLACRFGRSRGEPMAACKRPRA